MFQYCQKIVVFSSDLKKVLLARRKGEADYDGVYSLIGGKMETTDKSIISGIKREKDEEIGVNTKVNILPNETYNVLFRKNDGNSMILPHIPAIFVKGEIIINDEYSDYQWVEINKLDGFEPKIDTIPKAVDWAVKKIRSASPEEFVEI